jgi:hypothetical protein
MTTSIDAALALDPVSSGIFPPSVVLFSLRGSALFALRTFFLLFFFRAWRGGAILVDAGCIKMQTTLRSVQSRC